LIPQANKTNDWHPQIRMAPILFSKSDTDKVRKYILIYMFVNKKRRRNGRPSEPMNASGSHLDADSFVRGLP
jgi:hypothetical protein